MAVLTQTEVQAYRDKAEQLADDVRALAGLGHVLLGGLGWKVVCHGV